MPWRIAVHPANPDSGSVFFDSLHPRNTYRAVRSRVFWSDLTSHSLFSAERALVLSQACSAPGGKVQSLHKCMKKRTLST